MVRISRFDQVDGFKMSRVAFGKALYYTAAYWVDGLLVDTGCAHASKDFVQALGNRSVEWIVNTHSHEDHIASNHVLMEKFRIRPLAHPLALADLAHPRPLRPYQNVMWGYPAPSLGEAIGPRVETSHHIFEVLHTPGHSQGHICLYEAQRGWVFSGDLFIGGQDRALRADYNIWQILESLKKLAQLDIRWLFTGSGTVRQNPKRELMAKIQYLEECADRVQGLHARGLSYRQIRKRLFGPEMPIAYFTLGHFTGKHLVRSFVEDKARF